MNMNGAHGAPICQITGEMLITNGRKAQIFHDPQHP